MYCRYYEDITTCTPEGETLYNDDGTVVQSKLRLLSYTYPQATAGTIQSYAFDAATAAFSLVYTPLASVAVSNVEAITTDIYFNQELHYHSGKVSIVVSDASMFQITCNTPVANHITLLQVRDNVDQADVTVTVTRCRVGDENCFC